MASSRKSKAGQPSSSGSRKWLLPLLILLGLFLLPLGILNGSPLSNDPLSYRKRIAQQAILNSSQMNLAAYSDIIAAVAMHESDDFTSNVFKSSNNPFGMGVATQRPQKRTGTFGEYAKFANVEDATDDFVSWLKYKGYVPKTFMDSQVRIKDLVSFMYNNGYFTDSYNNYLTGVQRRYNELTSGQSASQNRNLYTAPPRFNLG